MPENPQRQPIQDKTLSSRIQPKQEARPQMTTPARDEPSLQKTANKALEDDLKLFQPTSSQIFQPKNEVLVFEEDEQPAEKPTQ